VTYVNLGQQSCGGKAAGAAAPAVQKVQGRGCCKECQIAAWTARHKRERGALLDYERRYASTRSTRRWKELVDRAGCGSGVRQPRKLLPQRGGLWVSAWDA